MGSWENMTMTNKKTTSNTNTNTKTMTNTFREHLQRAISETFDRWDIWSEWSRKHDLTNKKTMTKTNTKKIKMQWQIYLENTFKEQCLILLTVETFYQSDRENMTWPTKRQWQLENTFKVRSLGLLTVETFKQSNEKTWHDQQQRTTRKTKTKTKTITNTRFSPWCVVDRWANDLFVIM